MTFGRPIKKKPGGTAKRRAARDRKLKREERENKAFVRARDGDGHGHLARQTGRCRFPLCGCHERGFFVEVSHKFHKGMGGDPTGERSQPEVMICLCNWRHKEAKFSIDKKNLRWIPIDDVAGANGPVIWEMFLLDAGWFELAREVGVQILEALTPRGDTILNDLAGMRN